MKKKLTSTEACARALAIHRGTYGRAIDPTDAEVDLAEEAALIAYTTAPASRGEVAGLIDTFVEIETPDEVVRLTLETIRATHIARG